MLARARTYDRAAGYFSSTSLAAAAVGLERFMSRGGRIRLVVNHQLSDDDVAAVQRGLGLREAVQASLEKVALSAATAEGDEPARLRLLSTLVALGQLDLKVAVAADEQGSPLPPELVDRIHHAKFGVFTDRCDPACVVAFSGSNNETQSGWLANYERFDVYVSWKTESWLDHGQPILEEFEEHWDPNRHPPGWVVIELPEAARDGLIAGADPDLARTALIEQGRQDEIDGVVQRILAARGELDVTKHPLDDLDDVLSAPQKASGVALGTATVEYWPHQSDVARKVVAAWPCSRMFCDEVGLGKTIEVGALVRELLVSRKAERALLLVPASVIWQWQSEMWEKFSLSVPVLDGQELVWRGVPGPEGHSTSEPQAMAIKGNRWDAADVILASSHLARRSSERQHLIDRHWDLVVVDEAHHARRRGSKATKDDPNALLQLLRRMRDMGSWDGVLLATATPMQMQPHEAFDLLAILGLPGPHPAHPDDPDWSNGGAVGFNRYYEQLVIEDPNARDWRHLRAYARSHAAAFPGHNPHLEESIRHAAAQGEISRSASRKIPNFAEAISERPYRR
ncbi:MAG: SNF2-related protein, partial [Actinomycetota bacterium]|nr:SNF2-related protein [Actinomycetota bacterium]